MVSILTRRVAISESTLELIFGIGETVVRGRFGHGIFVDGGKIGRGFGHFVQASQLLLPRFTSNSLWTEEEKRHMYSAVLSKALL